MGNSDDGNMDRTFNFESQPRPQTGIIRDTQFIEKKLPVSTISNLADGLLLSKPEKGDLTDSFDLGNSDYEDDLYGAQGTDNDFIEYQYNRPRYSKKESINMVDHDFAKVEQDYIKKQVEAEKLSELLESEAANTSLGTPIRPKELDIDEGSDSDNEWKEIDTQLNCGDIYNLKGEKVDFFAHSRDDLTEQNTSIQLEKPKKKKTQLQKAAKTSAVVGKKVVEITAGVKIGRDEKEKELREKYQRAHLVNSDTSKQSYTRIDEEEQAKKFNEMDKKFDFLFQNENSNLRKLHNASSGHDSTDTLTKTTDDFMNNDNFDEIFGNEGHDENEMNPEIQMMSTKSMLNDSQKIAYAALVKLIIVQLTTDLVKVRGSGSTKILKKLAISHRSFMRWSMNVMNALYEHLDIKNEQEIKMIETLSCHGVETKDLTKSFESNVAIENHLNEENDKDVQLINMNVSELETSSTIEIDIKWTLICDLFLILLESSVYDARSRTLLLQFASAIGISNLEIYQFERRITDSLEIDEAFEILNNNQTWDESDILKEHKKRQRNAKIVKVALATAAGGLVIGLSAGALAPVIGAGLAAGLTTIGISGTGGFLAGGAGTAIITTSGVLSGMRAGKNAMQNRVGSVKTFEFIPLHNNRRVNLIITVSGWMSGTMDDIRLPFSTVDQVMGDLYSLLWEPEMLTSMGQTINILANEILAQSIQQILGSTLLITLMAGLQLPMMLSKLGYLLDNPWNNSLDRAWRSGKVLADTLRRNKLGVRPITLVGFSLGARLIYSCLLSLAKSGDFGIIENVYLFGSPFVINEDEIAQARSVVSGRFVNGYVKQDWILGYLFRATSGGLRTIAGLCPINEEKFDVENFNCAEFVKGHMQYREAMPKLLRMVGWEVLEDQFVEIEQPNPEEEERQRKLISDFEKAQHSKKKKSWYNKIFGRRNKEWWEMYEEGENEVSKFHKKGEGEGEDISAKEVEDSESETLVGVPGVFDIDALKKEVENIELEALKAKKNKAPEQIQKNDNENEEQKKVEQKKVELDLDNNTDVETVLEKTKSNNATMQLGSKTPDLSKNLETAKFHLSPKIDDHKAKPDLDLKTKKVRKRTSLIQLVESKESADLESPKPSTASQKTLKPFRISSQSSRKSSASGAKSPSLNLGVFQPITDDERKNTVDHGSVGKKDMNGDNKGAVVEPQKDGSKAIDYGDYDVPTEENIQLFFDDDLQAIEKKINETQKTKAGYGPVTGIDYGDEDEFPQDESNIQFSFE